MSAKLKTSPAFHETSDSKTRKETSDSSARFGIVLAGILFLAAMAYLSLAYNWPKFSRAEVFFAECVREMFQADNLVTPLYHGTPFFDKPILAYWFIAASYKVFGISHFAARIPSVLSALASIALTAFAGKHLFGSRQGTLAAAVLASSLMFLSFANLCMSDMNLLFFDTVSLSLLYLSLLQEKRRSMLLYLASLSMGLAFLTKGPVGIVLPAVSFAIYLSASKQWKKIQILKDILPSVLILAGAGVPWFMAAFRQNGAGALSYFFIHENLQRFAGSTYDTHRPIWFMLQSLASGMLPWSVFLPFALSGWLKSSFAKTNNQAELEEKSEPVKAYLWLWIAVVVGFFSLSRGKIDYYVLPAYPAAAILIANYLVEACDKKAKFASLSAWLFSATVLASGVASVIVLPPLFVQEGIACLWLLPSILLASSALMLYFSGNRQYLKTFKMLFVLVCLLAMAFSFQIYPWITSKQAVLKYVPYIRALGPDARVGVYTSLQNWIDEITYQTDCEPIKIEKIEMAEHFLKASCPSLLLIQESEFAQMSPQSRQSCHVIASNPFIPRSLNPIYLINKGQKLADKTRLLLISNFGSESRKTEKESKKP